MDNAIPFVANTPPPSKALELSKIELPVMVTGVGVAEPVPLTKIPPPPCPAAFVAVVRLPAIVQLEMVKAAPYVSLTPAP
jgi:hypothetical protein